MAKNIEPKLKKIGDYLKLEEDTVFTIPEYQRAYSWGIDNCDKLWQDINDFVESESKDRYFFGTIIINCQDNDTKYGLIDGQQRTTTFLLLLKAYGESRICSRTGQVQRTQSSGCGHQLQLHRHTPRQFTL